MEASSAQYILQQYIAASGGLKLSKFHWQCLCKGKSEMNPDMWYVELAIGGRKMLVAKGSLCGGTHLG
ncbi:hypothetical protein L195_g060440, partial [Trifolium pratense]